jgi:tripartite-type tricarboxylate transporter receptor subunit TctC
MHRRAVLVAALALALSGGGVCHAQDYPTRPVRLVVPFAPGGAVDVLARLVGAKLAEKFGQPVIVENHAGAGGNIGADVVAKSSPDGYTILLNTNGHAITPALYRHLPFDPVNDFAAVTQLVASSLILVASPKFAAKTTAEFVALAKARPGALNYGSSGVGNALHLTMEMLKAAAGIDVVAVAYRGDGQIHTALMAGDIQVALVPLATAVPLVADGRINALAVLTSHRTEVLPDVPTLAEAGIAGFTNSGWQGFFVAAKTPPPIIGRIAHDSAAVLKEPDVVTRFKAMAYEPVGSTPAEFSAFVAAETAKFARVVQAAHIPMQD